MSDAARIKGKYHYNYKIVDSKAHETKLIKLNDTQIKIIRYYKNGKYKTMGDYNEMPMELRDEIHGTEKIMDYVTEVCTKVGLHTWYHKNGHIFKCINYTDGIENMSDVEIYHDNGKVMETGDIDMGVRVGRWIYYNKRGKLIYYEDYRENGSTIEVPK